MWSLFSVTLTPTIADSWVIAWSRESSRSFGAAPPA
jgi:hypothetical protein